MFKSRHLNQNAIFCSDFSEFLQDMAFLFADFYGETCEKRSFLGSNLGSTICHVKNSVQFSL